ncbi:LPS assembly lipoprotein LptE [Stutzerimonas kirkiae]|uniref:LPS-assembly lipoprotein LptE n=1 Tax=Stutzerimonas kirkiae TaxID=2211392 RepID=A0A4V2KBY7_9GAMM|nr:LPS assembly lipoprotein LptE [Stutzerimonas kirkiae]TBU90085.1 hypothetical protein DNJ96_17160 [Stutzerimonas kirkiae]TBU99055.1 hypothetical protein DNJ95_17205 [Stutzerimonas kirkiae]TBV10211.1 hypothetical protein DNK01_18315 [Stutzerimonas kirkiae]TBV11649.1 hypothetical protein DNK08_03295 [Stutzerimonas kirkiae]
MLKRNLMMLGLALLLTGCGFQLRGTGNADFALSEIDLQARNNYGDTVKQLEQLLSSNGVRVHPGARYTLNLLREQEGRRTASYSGSARTAEYELSNRLDYEFRGPQDLLLLSDSVDVSKVYVHDENNLIGSSQEAVQLREEIRRDLLQQLVLRLQRITPAQLDRLQRAAEDKAHAERQALEAAGQEQAAPLHSPVQ